MCGIDACKARADKAPVGRGLFARQIDMGQDKSAQNEEEIDTEARPIEDRCRFYRQNPEELIVKKDNAQSEKKSNTGKGFDGRWEQMLARGCDQKMLLKLHSAAPKRCGLKVSIRISSAHTQSDGRMSAKSAPNHGNHCFLA